jgi:hypothetical protein
MRYVSEQARVLAHYRTLPQWLKIIRAISHCSARDAKQQILDGLKDGKFAFRWKETDAHRAGGCRPWKDATVTSEWINWRNGKIYCDQGLTDENRAAGLARWLTLLLAPRMATVFWEMFAALQSESPPEVRLAPKLSPTLLGAIRTIQVELGDPGTDVRWKTFNDRVRAICYATAQTRGFSDRNIERAVRSIRKQPAK